MNRSVSFDSVEIIEEKNKKNIGKFHPSQSSGDLLPVDEKVHRHFVKIDFYETCRDIKEIRTKLAINRKTRFSQEYHTKHHDITNKINDSRRQSSTAIEEQEQDGDHHDDDDDDEEEELPLKQCSGPKKKLNGTMKSRGLRRKSFSPTRIPPTASSRWQQNQSWPASSASSPVSSSRWQPNRSCPALSSSSRSLHDTPFDMKNNPFTSPSLDTTNHVPTIKQQQPRGDTAPRGYCRSTSPQVRRRPSPTINNLLAEIECARRLSPLCLDTTNHAPTSWPKQDAALFFVRDGSEKSDDRQDRRRGEDHHDHHVDTIICSSTAGELLQERRVASPSSERYSRLSAAGVPVHKSRYHSKEVTPELFNVGASLTTPPQL